MSTTSSFSDLSYIISVLQTGNRFILHYESIKRELKTRPINECRFDERLKTKDEESTRLEYTGFLGGLEHLKIETRLL